MGEIRDEFDFSEYPTDHPLHDKVNMKVVGKLSDELKACKMTKFVGLRPKLYSYEYLNKNGQLTESHTAKGVTKVVKNTKLSFADYEQCLRRLNLKSLSMNSIRSDHHKIYTLTVNKVGLSAFDDKRYICAPEVGFPTELKAA